MRFLLLLALFVPSFAGAQTVLLQAGDSSLFQSSGGGARIYNPDGSVMSFGIGTVNSGPLLFGGNVSKPFGNGFRATAGDMPLSFYLPTDVAQGNFGFLTRGFLLSHKDAGVSAGGANPSIPSGLLGSLAATLDSISKHCSVFAGVASTQYGAPWFQAARASSPLGYINCKDRLTENVTWTTLGAFSNKQTTIIGLTWASSGLTVSGSGGIGNNSAYGAVLGAFENSQRTFEAKLGYASVQDNFRRILSTSPSTLVSENTGLNGNFAWLVTKAIRVYGNHQHLLSPVLNGPSIGATLNSGGGLISLGRLIFHASDYSSTTNLGIKNSGQVFGSELRLANGVSLRGEYLHSKNNDVIISSVREHVRHFEFTQNYTRSTSTSQGQTASTNSFDGGVSYIGNGYAASLEYEEEYFPLVPAGQSPFKRVLSLSLSKTVRDAVISAQSYVTPQNRMKFSVQGSDYIYGKSVENERHLSSHRTLDRYIIRGRVVDTTGQNVFGALLQIDGQETYSGPDGSFFLRWSKPVQNVPVRVITSKFLSGNWGLVSAPETATAYLEGQDRFIEVVVRRQ
jgi:hypothetical protein